MQQEERAQLIAEIVSWLRDVAEADPGDPKSHVYREVASDIEKRWSTGEFTTDQLR